MAARIDEAEQPVVGPPVVVDVPSLRQSPVDDPPAVIDAGRGPGANNFYCTHNARFDDGDPAEQPVADPPVIIRVPFLCAGGGTSGQCPSGRRGRHGVGAGGVEGVATDDDLGAGSRLERAPLPPDRLTRPVANVDDGVQVIHSSYLTSLI